MDFLDPKKKKAHSVQLIIGYTLIAILILLGTTILLFLSYGFGLDKNGNIIQNGLVFVSSQPNPATISINGQPKYTTNARIILPSGQYVLQINKSGYRTWQRAFNLEGSSVEHFDYPFLFPTNLITKTTATYTVAPQVFSQSPDRRWLLISQTPDNLTFWQYDLDNPKQAPTNIAVPSSIIEPGINPQPNVRLLEWSNDAQHLLLKLTSSNGANSEIVLFDRQNPQLSIDLTKTLNLQYTETPQMINNAYNQYYVLNSADGSLFAQTLQLTTPKPVLSHVLAYKSYGTTMLLYATSQSAPNGKAIVRLNDNGRDYNITNVATGSTYLIDLAQYNGSWYFAIGSNTDGKVSIYKNAEQTLQNIPNLPLVPIDILHINQPSYLHFSSNTRFILAESGNNFAVYDAENDKAYSYIIPSPVDAPQVNATWMDGARIILVSKGKVTIFDYDGANLQQLESAESTQVSFFDKTYKFLYTIAPNSNSNKATVPYSMTNTAMQITP